MSDGCQNFDRGQLGPRKPKSEPPVRSSELVVPPGCACVSHDAMDCARIRDGFDTDDEHWDHRKCECVCHCRSDDDDDDY